MAPERAAGVDVISLGIGDPDLPTPPHIVSRHGRGRARPAHPPVPEQPRRRSSSARPWPAYYATRFGVTLDPETEIVPLLGAKEGIAHICFALLDPGDVCPGGRPRLPGLRHRAGARRRRPPCTCRCVPELGFQPDLEDIEPAARWQRAKMIFVSYPNNPTGAVIEDDFFARLVAFAREHDIVVVHDNAYADITYDGYVAPELPRDARRAGGRRRAVLPLQELQHDRLARRRHRRQTARSSTPTGASRPTWTRACSARVQRAAAAALTGPQDCVAEMCRALRSTAATCSCTALRDGRHARRSRPRAPSTCGCRCPTATPRRSFTEQVLEQADVIVSPGAAYGPSGEGYVRLSLTVPDDRLEEAVRRIEERVRL